MFSDSARVIVLCVLEPSFPMDDVLRMDIGQCRNHLSSVVHQADLFASQSYCISSFCSTVLLWWVKPRHSWHAPKGLAGWSITWVHCKVENNSGKDSKYEQVILKSQHQKFHQVHLPTTSPHQSVHPLRMAPSHNRQRNFAVSTAPGGAVSQGWRKRPMGTQIGQSGVRVSRPPKHPPCLHHPACSLLCTLKKKTTKKYIRFS